MTRALQVLSLLLVASWAAYCTPTFQINGNDICQNANCSTGGNSYVGPNAGTGEGDYSGVMYKGTSDPNDSFDSGGFICTSASPQCGPGNYASGLTISRDTTEFQNLNIYRFFDTFTNDTSNTISGDIVFYTNLAWLSGVPGDDESAVYPYSTDTSQLVVITPSGGDRPSFTLVTGNNTWTNDNVNYYLDGRSPTDSFYVSLAPGQSISILQFMGLSADEPSPGTYVSDPAAALAMGNDLLNNPYLDGLTQQQLDSVINWDFDAPEPGTLGLLGAGLALAFLKLRSRAKASAGN